jgi:NAD(P)H-hydrate epimerase
MENAAHAAARIITEKFGGPVAGKSFLILCGKGNNGGDGAAIGRILFTQGASVDVYLFGKVEDTKNEARTNFEIVKNLAFSEYPDTNKLFFEEAALIDYWLHTTGFGIDKFDFVIDALFGTGLTRPLDSTFGLFSQIYSETKNYSKKPFFISLDLPSGLNADLGQPVGYNFKAGITVTFTAPKPANVLPPASRFNGELVTVNIGSPPELIDNSPSQLFVAEKTDAENWLRQTKFTDDSHKTARGRALIIAGSKKMAGAAVLCANAAIISGAGLIRVATPESALNAVAARTAPEALIAGVAETENGAISEAAFEEVFELTKKTDVVAVGSGLSSDEETTKAFVRSLVENRKFPLVIDADGLNALAPFDVKGSDEFPLILTPHIGEMRKLLGVDESADLTDRVKLVREFAQKHHVILVLKGERSLIAEPGGKVVVNPTGNSGLGKAGSGDTLAGIITGFIAQGVALKIDIFETVVAALYISGVAGDIAAGKIGKRSMTASHVRECLADAFREFEND